MTSPACHTSRLPPEWIAALRDVRALREAALRGNAWRWFAYCELSLMADALSSPQRYPTAVLSALHAICRDPLHATHSRAIAEGGDPFGGALDDSLWDEEEELKNALAVIGTTGSTEGLTDASARKAMSLLSLFKGGDEWRKQAYSLVDAGGKGGPDELRQFEEAGESLIEAEADGEQFESLDDYEWSPEPVTQTTTLEPTPDRITARIPLLATRWRMFPGPARHAFRQELARRRSQHADLTEATLKSEIITKAAHLVWACRPACCTQADDSPCFDRWFQTQTYVAARCIVLDVAYPPTADDRVIVPLSDLPRSGGKDDPDAIINDARGVSYSHRKGNGAVVVTQMIDSEEPTLAADSRLALLVELDRLRVMAPESERRALDTFILLDKQRAAAGERKPVRWADVARHLNKNPSEVTALLTRLRARSPLATTREPPDAAVVAYRRERERRQQRKVPE